MICVDIGNNTTVTFTQMVDYSVRAKKKETARKSVVNKATVDSDEEQSDILVPKQYQRLGKSERELRRDKFATIHQKIYESSKKSENHHRVRDEGYGNDEKGDVLDVDEGVVFERVKKKRIKKEKSLGKKRKSKKNVEKKIKNAGTTEKEERKSLESVEKKKKKKVKKKKEKDEKEDGLLESEKKLLKAKKLEKKKQLRREEKLRMKREVKNDMKDTQATTRSQVVLQSIPLPQVSSLRANTPPGMPFVLLVLSVGSVLTLAI